MVISGPDLRVVGRGRKACVESYSRFSASSRILDFKEADHRIEVWGDAALVSYRFVIEYEFGGRVNSDTGIDVFLFTREDGRWQAAWRIVLPVPSGSGEDTAS